MKVKAPLLAVALSALLIAKPQAAIAGSIRSVAAARAEAKVQHIETNGELAHPDRRPTEFTADEINAYFASGEVDLPAGVQSVRFQGTAGVVTASCRVDFDQVEAGRNSANPLLSLFSGIHDVVVVANAAGAGGEGNVEVQSVSLDGVEIPRFVLGLFVDKFLTPRYPNVGLDSRFSLPDKIESAVVGADQLSITQK
ncbi:MAG: hypothetical protein ACRD2U_02600 [Terriglobales bacterium]